MSGIEVKSLKYNLIGGGVPFGCKVSDGKIIPALSEGKLDATAPKKVWYATFARGTDRIFALSDSEMYTAEENGAFKRIAADTAKIPFVIDFNSDGKAVTRFLCDNRYIQADKSGASLDTYTQYFGGGIYKNGRVFAIDLRNTCKIRWSGEGGVDDWEGKIDGAGWLHSDVELGEIYRLYTLRGQIVALRKNGISLINAYGAPENFKEIASVVTPPPYKECAAVCGNKLYFYTNDGLYSFNAAGAEKVNIELGKDFVSPVCSMAYGDHVFFTGTHKELEKTVVLVYDTNEKSSYFIDLEATALCAGSLPYAFTSRGMITLERGGPFKYRSQEFAGFSKRNKTLKSLYVSSEIEVDVTVETDKGSRLFKGVKGELKPHICGRCFKVEISGKANEISELTAQVDYY